MFERCVFSSFFPWPCVCYYSFTFPRKEEKAQHEPACPSMSVLLSLFTQNRLLSCVSSSVAMSFLLLCCRKRIMAAPAQKHMQNIQRPTLSPRVPATTREITFIMGYTISQCGLPRPPLLWTFISQGLEQGREVSTCLFAVGPSPLALNAVLFICMIRHMQMSRVLLWPCVVLLCCECPRTLPLIRTCLQRHHCLFVVVICHTL